MLNVTEKAVERLRRTLEEHGADKMDVLRLQPANGSLGLAVGQELEGDQTVKAGDRTVLAIDEELARGLDGASIDLVDTSEGSQLVFRPAKPHV